MVKIRAEINDIEIKITMEKKKSVKFKLIL